MRRVLRRRCRNWDLEFKVKLMEFEHTPVLLNEVIEGLAIRPGGIYLDGTVGGGGHAYSILEHLNENGRLIGIDKDDDALEKAREVLSPFKNQVDLVYGNYENFDSILDGLGIDSVDGILIDIGVSSHQLDDGERGFSYNYDALLDMRMDRNQKLTARDIVNRYNEEDLTRIFYDYGEEAWAKRIAQFIVRERENNEINTTNELTDIIKAAIPKAKRRDKHPSRKVFQALRIETNDELGVLERSIDKMIVRLKPKGRLAIITFHSLEDRIVKEKFRYAALDCICPPEIPVCVCDKKKEINIITKKAITASEEELNRNRRARSAKLRIAEKI